MLTKATYIWGVLDYIAEWFWQVTCFTVIIGTILLVAVIFGNWIKEGNKRDALRGMVVGDGNLPGGGHIHGIHDGAGFYRIIPVRTIHPLERTSIDEEKGENKASERAGKLANTLGGSGCQKS